MPREFYTTKLTIEIDIETQCGPQTAVSVLQSYLDLPAITGLKIVKLESDYPLYGPLDVNRKTITNIPLIIK